MDLGKCRRDHSVWTESRYLIKIKTFCFCQLFNISPFPHSASFPWHSSETEDTQDGAACAVPEVSEKFSSSRKMLFFYNALLSFLKWAISPLPSQLRTDCICKYWLLPYIWSKGLPWCSDSKESTCNVGEPGWIPGSGRSPLEEGMATHSSILAWEIPWTEESGGLQSMGSQRVRHNWETNTSTTTGYRYVYKIDSSCTHYPLIFFFPVPFLWHKEY